MVKTLPPLPEFPAYQFPTALPLHRALLLNPTSTQEVAAQKKGRSCGNRNCKSFHSSYLLAADFDFPVLNSSNLYSPANRPQADSID